MIGETQSVGEGGDNIALLFTGEGELRLAKYFGGVARDVLT